jgi:hypothetical protein
MKREWAAPSGVVTSMSTNPLFTNNPVRPEPADDAAVRIRAKVSKIYGEEPSASAS